MMNPADACNDALTLSAYHPFIPASIVSHPMQWPVAPRVTLSQCHVGKKRKERARVILFTNSLIKYVEAFVTPEYAINQVKTIIRQCILQNRKGDPTYLPLSKAMIVKVRKFLGEHHWSRLISFHKFYIEEMGRKKVRGKRCLQQQQQQQYQHQLQLQPKLLLPQSELSLSTALGMIPLPSLSQESFRSDGGGSIFNSTPLTGETTNLQGW